MNAYLAMALDTYRKLQLAERRVERLTSSLAGQVILLSADDEAMGEYVRITTEMDAGEVTKG